MQATWMRWGGCAALVSLLLACVGCKPKADETPPPPPATPSAEPAPAPPPATMVPAADLANTHCPIMRNPLPQQVPATLVRTYQGRQIGFCCAGCPAAWEKLTDAEKDAALAAAAPATAPSP